MTGPGGERRPHFNEVLLICDETHTGDLAFRWALEAARENSASLHVVGIIRSIPFAADFILESATEQDEARFGGLIAKQKEVATAKGVRMSAEIVFGVLDEQILRRVVGHHRFNCSTANVRQRIIARTATIRWKAASWPSLDSDYVGR